MKWCISRDGTSIFALGAHKKVRELLSGYDYVTYTVTPYRSARVTVKFPLVGLRDTLEGFAAPCDQLDVILGDNDLPRA